MSTRGTSTGRWAGVAVAGVIILSLASIGAHALLIPGFIRAADASSRSTGALSTPTTVQSGQGGTGSTTSTSSPAATDLAPTAVPAMPAYDRACLRRDNPATGAKIPANDPFGDDIADLGDKAELQRLYAVQSGALVPLDGLGAPRPCDEQLLSLIHI